MNPIQVLPMNDTLNYFCSWATQGYVGTQKEEALIAAGAFTGDQGGFHAREQMNEEFLFGKEGVVSLWGDLRKNLYLVLDDGWDVPYGANTQVDQSAFGSQEIDKERFPFLKGSPAERLKQISNRVKAAGWRGLGIWVSPQKAGIPRENRVSLEEAREYWQERLEWSKYASVCYWKVDWGNLSDPEYRDMLTELAGTVYPELHIEQTKTNPPLNGILGTDKNRFVDSPQNRAARTKRNYETSRIFRTYDVTDDHLSATTTLDRLSFLFSLERGGFINCEDELYIGAALGCAVGIMRSPFGAKNYQFCRRLQEVYAAIHWLSIAPPFVGGGYLESDAVLTDLCQFKEGDTWYAQAIGKIVTQAAPAIMARNTELPRVRSGEKAPFVIASHNPNGIYSVAAVRRYRYFTDTDAPDVTCNIKDAKTVGCFGRFASLTLQTETPVTRVMAYDLINMTSQDITNQITRTQNATMIDGKTLASLCKINDESEPAVMLSLSF